VMPAMGRIANAQAYPARPVRIVVGSLPGSAPDVIARLLAQWLSERFEKPFVVENRDGANGAIAGEVVARAPADGYALLLVSATYTIDPSVFAAANFNFRRDMAPIANAVRLPGIISVNPSLPVRTLAEFIAYAKANPDKVNIGSGGIGSPQYVAGELFIMMTGARLSMIAYRGGPPALTDAMSGQIQGLISAILLVVDQVRAGNLRALAVTSTSRSELLPDVPTVAETVPGFAADQWIGMAAPRGTPDNVIATLNAGINAALADPAIKRTIASLGGMPMPSTPADFGQFLTDETDKWAKVVKFSGVKAD